MCAAMLILKEAGFVSVKPGSKCDAIPRKLIWNVT